METTELYAVAGNVLEHDLINAELIIIRQDFCLIPIGTANPSVAEEIAECQRILVQSGLVYKMHGYGTNIEGPWSKVSQAIHDCHAAVHAVHAKGAQRIATDIRIGTRIDRSIPYGQGNDLKVRRVQEILEND